MGNADAEPGAYFAPDLLQDKVAVVTGGAGALGGSICQLFAAHGCNVVCADVAADRVRALADASPGAPGQVIPFVADLTAKEGMEALREEVERRFGGTDILVNAVGENLDSWGPFESSDEATWQALYEVNLLNVFRACKAFLPSMKDRGWGRIVNFSSVEGIRSAPWLAAYTAFKRAVDSFTKSMGVDVARYGILVNAIAVDKVRAYQSDHYRLPDEYLPLIPTFIPAGRYGEPEDVALLALFLASPLNRWIVAQTVVADGGTLSAGGWYRTPKRWTNQPVLTQWVEDPAANESRPRALQ
jgi:2-hydroxycyclohexanecarboxyl-CoA dehydrogenase